MKSALDSIRLAYDLASQEYSHKFIDELDRKPFDRELLQQFTDRIAAGKPVLDIGCGPGHTTAHLASLGLKATGVDLSPKLIELAKVAFPQSSFEVGNFFDFPHKSSSIGGILAFYCIVHLNPNELLPAFVEFVRVLEIGGVLLLAFHVGSETILVENFLGTEAILDFVFHDPAKIQKSLRAAGFNSIETHIRDPYESEHPSQRCYIFAQK